MPLPNPQQIPFPASGLHEDAGYDNQPPLTTNAITNVRSHDALKGRIRGGRRPGLAKYHSTAMNGSEAVQHIMKVTEPTAYSTIVEAFLVGKDAQSGEDMAHFNDAGTLIFTEGIPDDVNGIAWDGTDYYIATEGTTLGGHDSGNINSVFCFNTSLVDANISWSWDIGGAGHRAECLQLDETNGRVYVGGDRTSDWEGGAANASVWALNQTTGAVLWDTDLGTAVYDVRYNATDDTLLCLTALTNTNWVGQTKTASIFLLDASDGSVLFAWSHGTVSFNTDHKCDIRSDGTVIVAHRTGNTSWEGNSSDEKNVWVLNSSLVVTSSFLLEENGNSLDSAIVKWYGTDGDFIFVARDNGSDGSVKLYNSAGTSQWSFDPGHDNIQVTVSSPLSQVAVIVPTNTNYDGAGTTKEFFLLNPSSGAIVTSLDFGASLSNADPLVLEAIVSSGAGPLATRSSSLVIVAGGTVKKLINDTLTTPTAGSSAFTDEPYRVNGAQLFTNVFYVDATNAKYYDLTADEVKDWATDVTGGTLPASTRLIARYRGRIVLAGQVADSANWFMSAAGDPFDFDFAPAVTSAIQAVAGNASEVGLVGDMVTALMPFSDDAMLIGGDQSIWQMSGDPAAGGSLDLVTDKVGVAWNAWTQDPDGAIYFLSLDGVYRIQPGQRPVKLTQNRLDERFKAIDLTQVRCIMAWDLIRQGLVLTLASSLDVSQTTYFWDSRTDAWTIDTYPASMGPSFLYAHNAEAADDAEFLLGCKDSFVREVSTAATNDDGTAIAASVRYKPVALTDGRTTGILQAVDVALADGSGDVTLKVYTGQTAEECMISTSARFARTLTAGKNAIATHNIRGRYVQIELSSADTSIWAVENVFVTTRPSGQGRQKRA